MKGNKVLFGLENVHFAFLSDDDQSYEKPMSVPGAVNVALTAEGEEYVFYADNRAYYAMDANNGYSGDLELAKLPDEVLTRALGWETDETTGAVVEVADGIQKPFALLFEIKGDKTGRRYVFYNCKMSRPNSDRSTVEETPEVQTETATLSALPIQFKDAFNGKAVVKAHVELTSDNAESYNSFFDDVMLPKANALSV